MKGGNADVIVSILPSGYTSDFSFSVNFLFLFPSAYVSPLPLAHFLPPAASCAWFVASPSDLLAIPPRPNLLPLGPTP